MSGCEAKQPTFTRGMWILCGKPSTAVYAYRCGHGHAQVMETCDEHRPVEGAVGCSWCWDQGRETPMTFAEVRDDPAEDDGPAVGVEAVGGLEVCDLCGFPAVRVPDGRWMHAEVADGVFCAIFHPRGIGSGGSE